MLCEVIAQICHKTRVPNLGITNTLAPQTWKSGDRTREDILEIRQDFFQKYIEILKKKFQIGFSVQNNLKFLRELSSKTSNNDINVVISKLIEKELSALMLSNSSDSYVFDIIESPHEPELKSKPSRAIFCISAFFRQVER